MISSHYIRGTTSKGKKLEDERKREEAEQMKEAERMQKANEEMAKS